MTFSIDNSHCLFIRVLNIYTLKVIIDVLDYFSFRSWVIFLVLYGSFYIIGIFYFT